MLASTLIGESSGAGLPALYHGVPGRMRSFFGFFEKIDEISWFIASSKIEGIIII